MFSLVQEIRAMPQHGQTPIVCVRGTPTRLREATRKGIEDAVRVVGGTAFIELEVRHDDVARLGEALEKILNGERKGSAPLRGSAP
jgi:hypothetical protein